MRRQIALTAAVLATLPAAALAAEPESGEVSKGSPSVIWTGATTNAWFNYTLINSDNARDCTAPMCDRFTLKVVDGGVDLVVKVRMDETGQDGSNGQGGIRITAPDGTRSWTVGESGPDQDLKTTVKKAKPGEYLIDFTNTFVGGEQTHAASAELLFPPPPVTPAPVAPVAPATSPAPPASAETTLTLNPFKARASRKLTARVSSSGPVTGVTAVLARGGRKLATAKLARLDGAGRLVLKARKKLKPGRYLLTVTGRDGGGRTITAQTAVTIRR